MENFSLNAIEDDVVNLYSIVNDFSNWHDNVYGQLQEKSKKKPTNKPGLAECEIMTILLLFFKSKQKFFKHFYNHFKAYNQNFFSQMQTYERFMELRKRAFLKLVIFLKILQAFSTNEVYVDSTPIKVCHRKRRKQYKTLKLCATSACSTMGKFFGLKLHIAVDSRGNIFNFKFTTGKIDDRKVIADLLSNFTGTVFGDKGYISARLKELLCEKSINLVTRMRKNMKQQELPQELDTKLKKRTFIESIFSLLKEMYFLESNYYRSKFGFLLRTICILITYQMRPSKPHIV